MGPKSKKQPKNGFYYYMLDYVESERQRGRNISMQIAAEESGKDWQAMSLQAKDPYLKQAQLAKKADKDDLANKYTCNGKSYLQVHKEEKEAQEFRARMDDEINSTCSKLVPASIIRTHKFYLVHCNFYCRTAQGMFVPAELAITQFSLQNGIEDCYHCLVDPSNIPIGYAFEAKMTHENVHNLPLPPYKGGQNDYFKIFQDIILFLEPGRMSDGRIPPLYTVPNNMDASKDILNRLASSGMDNSEATFRIYPIEKLLFRLKNRCAESSSEGERNRFAVLSNAAAEVEKDVFCYTRGICCEYHEACDEKFHNCSMSITKRLVYLIVDHCCFLLGIPLTAPNHCSIYSDTEHSSRVTSARQSLCPSVAPSEVGDFEPPVCESSSASVVSGARASIYQEERRELKPLRLPKTQMKTFVPNAPSDTSSQVGSSLYLDAEDGEWTQVSGRGRGRSKPASVRSVGFPAEPEPAEDLQLTNPRGRGSRLAANLQSDR